jgi:MotA/TolQ/ExbB proton channel family
MLESAFFLAWLGVVVACGAITWRVVQQAWAWRQQLGVWVQLLAVFATVAATAMVLGTTLGGVRGILAVMAGGEEPARKARLLGEAIADAINATVYGLAALIPALWILHLCVRRARVSSIT